MGLSRVDWVDAEEDADPGLNICEFSLEHYRAILNLATQLGYRCLGCSDYLRDSSGKTLLLRHDVDISLADAVRLAEMEAELGVRSTFFVLATGRRYDLLSPHSVDNLHRLLELGAEIGLHYDTGRSYLDPQLIAGAIAGARKTLEKAAGVPVLGGTMHMPRRAVMHPTRADILLAGLTYDPGDEEFNRGTKFLSDSRRSWNDGCLCQHLGRSPKLYALIHPFWWCNPEADVEAILRMLRSDG
jgi:hypothetical protein